MKVGSLVECIAHEVSKDIKNQCEFNTPYTVKSIFEKNKLL